MAAYEITWNEVSSTTIPEFTCEKVRRDLLGEFRGAFVNIPGRDGSWHFPEQRGRRVIVLECRVLTTEEAFVPGRRSAVTQVANWLDIGAEARLVIGDDPLVFYNAVLTSPTQPDEWRQLGKFDLLFSAEPYAYDLDASAYETTQDTGTEWTHNFDILSDVYPVIEITNNSGGPVDSLIFTINGVGITYLGVIADGDTVTINSIGMAFLAGISTDVSLTGAYNPASLLMQYVTGAEFPILHPGLNTINMDSVTAGAEMDIRITYRKRYRN